MSKQDRVVYRNDHGQWVNKRADASRAASIHETQKQAVEAAREILHKQRGGELIICGGDGKIRSKDTVRATPNHRISRIRSTGRLVPVTRKSQHVVSRSDGRWSVRTGGSARVSRTFPRKADAIDYGRGVARDKHAELYIHTRDGRIQERSSYARNPLPAR
jgi:Uncharacterized protein conserved in bacteria (DUF2188)